MPYSPQERQRRSDLAKELHRRGVFGGRQPARKSAEVRARRASELSAEIIEKHRGKIERAIVAGLDSSSTSHRLKAAELALKMGMRSEALDAGVAKTEIERMDREEAIRVLEEKLTTGPIGAIFRARLLAQRDGSDVIEGRASEIAR